MKNQKIIIASIVLLFLVFSSSAYAGGYDCEYPCFGSGKKTCNFKIKKKGEEYIGQHAPIFRTYEHIDRDGFLVLYSPYTGQEQAHVDVRIINKKNLSFVISSTYIYQDGKRGALTDELYLGHKGDGGHRTGRCKIVE
ncbi:hypothetical protein M1M85_01745 [Nitrospinaceae bacterium]|nr:hypothetical protein [Nitrospinaceae bacterium]